MEKKVIITIGREFGSGGKDVAIALGRILDIPVYDKELITRAAKDSGVSQSLFEDTDEKKNFLSFLSFNFQSEAYADNYINDHGLFKIQSETIMSIAENGPAIIVGRCADYILRDHGNTADIFITAPLAGRIARVARKEGLPEEKAEELILKKDRQREAYYNYYTFGKWGTASNYDLCVDSSVLGIEGTAEFIAEFVRRKNR